MAHHAYQIEHFDISEEEARAIEQAIVGRPFDILGPHFFNKQTYICTFQPGASRVQVIAQSTQKPLGDLTQSAFSDNIFVGVVPSQEPYLLQIEWESETQITHDPYSFAPTLGELDLHLINEGKHFELNQVLGAHVKNVGNTQGVSFAVWAPNARRVSVVGDFNCWDGRRHPMRKHEKSGVWELFIPELGVGTVYKYEILSDHGILPLKADPVALQAEPRPGDASVVSDPEAFAWTDDEWLAQRQSSTSHQTPMSIYEVHATSWRRREDQQNRPLNWDELADELIPYVTSLGFTHIELLPISAHPFGGSWGYQPVGLFAPLPECGTPEMFAHFVDRCHNAGLGVIIDWVPAHFPTDPHGLMHFDGTALYEHHDAREGYHPDWNTLIYNLGRHEVRGYLLANALHWIEKYHIDGLRVDAVASMLYRDYSRQPDQWIPNIYGGRENLETIDFLRELNTVVQQRAPSVLVIAEESTAWPGVTHNPEEGGLGFSYKWNMGWMHDTLNYIQKDPIYRRYHHGELTFCLLYAFSEKFVLPLSHDEVVHGKASMLMKMPGDLWQKFANLRSYYGFMWAHPGKKLMFMGDEFGQLSEWNHDQQLQWSLLQSVHHRGAQNLIADLNHVYKNLPALHSADCDNSGFVWLVGDDADNSVFAFYRAGVDDATPPVVIICNFTPTPITHYRLGFPRLGRWREVINTDAEYYGGSNMGNGGAIYSTSESSHWQAFSAEITLPPLSTLYFVYDEIGS